MKKLTTLWMIILMLGMSIPAMGAMSMSKMRQNARFLTDRMAYELKLTPMQYDDVYEVNYDFLDNIRHVMDDVVRGHAHALDHYYQCLDYRNDDLRWILSNSQYRRFMGVEYFCRPIYTTPTSWLFRIYEVYRDINHFYFDKPHHYRTYKGAHYRTHFGHESYYKNHRREPAPHAKPAPKDKVKPRKDVKPEPGKKEKVEKKNHSRERSGSSLSRTPSRPVQKKDNQDGRRAARGR